MVQQDSEAGAPTEILLDRTTRGSSWLAVDGLRTPGRRSRKRGHQATDEWSAEEKLEVKGITPADVELAKEPVGKDALESLLSVEDTAATVSLEKGIFSAPHQGREH